MASTSTRISRVYFLVGGHPAPKGSRVFLGKGRGSRESSDRCKSWVEQIIYAARANRPAGGPLEPPYDIELSFTMPEGQRPKYGWPTKDGDLDKLVRACLDGLTQGGMLVDDRHVTRIVTTKAFGSPGVSIRIA